MLLTSRKNTIKFAACTLSLLIYGDPGKSTRPRYGPSLVHSDDSNTLLIALRRCHPSRGRLRFMAEDLCCGYSLDGSDFPCYLLWPKRTPTGSFCLLNLKHSGMLILNMQAFFIHLDSGGKGGLEPTVQTPPRCYWVYTCNEVAQGESTIGLVEVSLSVYS